MPGDFEEQMALSDKEQQAYDDLMEEMDNLSMLCDEGAMQKTIECCRKVLELHALYERAHQAVLADRNDE